MAGLLRKKRLRHGCVPFPVLLRISTLKILVVRDNIEFFDNLMSLADDLQIEFCQHFLRSVRGAVML